VYRKLTLALTLCLQFQSHLAFAGQKPQERPPGPAPQRAEQAPARRPEAAPIQQRNDGARREERNDDASRIAAGADAAIGIIGLVGALTEMYNDHQQLEEDQKQLDDSIRQQDICSAIYSGKFKSGAKTTLDLGDGGQTATLTDTKSGASYQATGTCVESTDSLSAKIKFTLNDDSRYTFSGKITSINDPNFAYTMTLTEAKSGKAIDQLKLAK
jgi:hypothetical protein